MIGDFREPELEQRAAEQLPFNSHGVEVSRRLSCVIGHPFNSSKSANDAEGAMYDSRWMKADDGAELKAAKGT